MTIENYSAYRICKAPAEGILLIRHPAYGMQIWSLCRMTKKHKDDKCVICGLNVGEQAYRPLTNKGNRMLRICTRHKP
jgi:hypothetical protein